MKNIFSSKLFSLFLFIVIPVSVYFINVEVQSYFGKRAFENTGLQSYSLQESLAKAKAENKLVLVDVSAVWCGTCRKLDNEVFANEQVRKTLDEKFVFTRIEFETPEGEEFLEKRNTYGVPNLWVLDSNGNDVKRLPITFDPSEFLNELPQSE
jgi:thiol:disulfide interchange protein